MPVGVCRGGCGPGLVALTWDRLRASGVPPVHELVEQHRVLVVIPVRDDEDILVVPRDVVAAAGGIGIGVDDDGCGRAG
jgi:hypothetical protein